MISVKTKMEPKSLGKQEGGGGRPENSTIQHESTTLTASAPERMDVDLTE